MWLEVHFKKQKQKNILAFKTEKNLRTAIYESKTAIKYKDKISLYWKWISTPRLLFRPFQNITIFVKDIEHLKVPVLLPSEHVKKKKKTVPLLNDAWKLCVWSSGCSGKAATTFLTASLI